MTIVEITDGWGRHQYTESFTDKDDAREYVRKYNNTHWHSQATVKSEG